MSENRDLRALLAKARDSASDIEVRAIEQAGEIPMEDRIAPPPPLKPRLTVVEHVYHQEGGGKSPTGADSVSARFLLTDEQPFIRKTRIGETWVPVEAGWLRDKGVSLVRIANEATVFTVYPSPQEKEEADRKVLEIGMEVDSQIDGEVSSLVVTFAVVRPGESIRFEPDDFPSLRVRCRSGFAQVTIHVFPE